MERLYEIENEYIKIILDVDIYPIIVIEKTISNFLDIAFAKMEKENNKIIVKLVLTSKQNTNNIVGKFYNELLEESLRYNIARETKDLRELIVGRALYSTCIEVDNVENEKETIKVENESFSNTEEKDYDIEEIAVNWFEKNTNKEEK